MSDLISRQAAIDELISELPEMNYGFYYAEKIKALPSTQPEIVRCKDCKYRGGLSGFYCDIVEKVVGVDNFCSWAERRADDKS